MSTEITGYYIFGYTTENKTFRPSDWLERIASVYGTFESKNHLRYHPMIKPASYEGERCLFLDGRLLESNPEAFNFVMNFAKSNSLQMHNKGMPMQEGYLENDLQQVA